MADSKRKGFKGSRGQGVKGEKGSSFFASNLFSRYVMFEILKHEVNK